ncbi:MAG: molybdenum cofactor guanylyltransferase [Bacteroidia bacterium]|nr:molybdenum cofactor guanylyltransferase [Bacteroidia bacterium]
MNSDKFTLNTEIDLIEKNNDLIGLILCGGKSKRMQTDKAFIQYHDKPQLYYLYNQIKPICSQVYLSCNQNQVSQINSAYQIIIDSLKYQNIGPISAILSAMEIHQNKSFLVLACDYPFLTNEDIINIKSAWENKNSSVSFYNHETNFREPLLAIYHLKDLQKLAQFYKEENSSLQYFLNEINAEKIQAILTKNLTSIDTKEAFEITYKLIYN